MRRVTSSILVIACLLASAAVPAANNSSPASQGRTTTMVRSDASCRANNGTRLPPRLYRKYSCLSCFRFMYSRALQVVARAKGLRFVNVTQFAADACAEFVAQEPKQAPPAAECAAMLRRCCGAASACCGAQLTEANQRLSGLAGEYCPATWDGLYCVNATARGTVAEFRCPDYLPSANINNTFTITCTDDGTWETKTSGGVVWESTNYVTCLNNSIDEWDIIPKKISLSFYCVSLCFLLPAIAIFLGYETLRRQQRIIIHVNLFLALSLDAALSIATIKLYHIDVNERSLRSLESASQAEAEIGSILHNGGIGCIVLSMLHRTMQSAMFMWIFVEGFYLHRLLIRTFDREKSLWTYYVLGWGAAVLINAAYCALRVAVPHFRQFNGRCWISDAHPLEWLKDGANLLCILLNVIFFINILRILLKKLHSNANDTNNYRRAFKATCILVPLFGLQWLLMMYRQDRAKVNAAIIAYRIVQAALRGSHGAIVATVFCFANNEVTSQIHKSFERRGFRNNRLSRPSIDNRPTVYSSVPTGAPRDSIPMSTLPTKATADLSVNA